MFWLRCQKINYSFKIKKKYVFYIKQLKSGYPLVKGYENIQNDHWFTMCIFSSFKTTKIMENYLTCKEISTLTVFIVTLSCYFSGII